MTGDVKALCHCHNLRLQCGDCVLLVLARLALIASYILPPNGFSHPLWESHLFPELPGFPCVHGFFGTFQFQWRGTKIPVCSAQLFSSPGYCTDSTSVRVEIVVSFSSVNFFLKQLFSIGL